MKINKNEFGWKEKVSVNTDELPDDLSIPNSLTVGTRIGDIGGFSVSEGDENTASGVDSHAEGSGTIASSQNQHVQGKYNIEDTENKYAHIVGNGTADNTRSNAHTLDWQGNAWYQGKLSQDGTPTEDKDLTTKKYVDDKTKILPVKNTYTIFEDAVPHLQEEDYIFDSLQNEDMIISAIKFNLNVTFNDGTNDITKNLILKSNGDGCGFYEGNDIIAVINYYKTEHSICMDIIEPNKHITCNILRATLSCDTYSNLLQNHLIQNIDYNKIEDVPLILSSIVNGKNRILQGKEYYNLFDNLFIWDTNKFNERLDENSGVKQNLTIGHIIQVKQKDGEGIGFGQHIPVDSSEDICIVANAGADVIIKVYNSTTKELIDTLDYFENGSYTILKLNSNFLNGATSIFLAFTVKDSVTNFRGNTYITDLIVYNDSSFLVKGELLTKTNIKEYEPTDDYNPATKKYVDDAIASQPQISFDTEGNLVVTIGGVTKKFKEITE